MHACRAKIEKAYIDPVLRQHIIYKGIRYNYNSIISISLGFTNIFVFSLSVWLSSLRLPCRSYRRLLQLKLFPGLVVGTSTLRKPRPGFIGLSQEVFHVNVHKFSTRDRVFYDFGRCHEPTSTCSRSCPGRTD